MVTKLEEAKKLIDELDLTHIMERVMKEKRWTRRMVEVTTHYYKNFLYLSKKYKEYRFSPSTQIDEIWHAHILYTKDYHEMCEKVFGFYLHHQPTINESDHAEDVKGLEKLLEMFPLASLGIKVSYKILSIYSFEILSLLRCKLLHLTSKQFHRLS